MCSSTILHLCKDAKTWPWVAGLGHADELEAARGEVPHGVLLARRQHLASVDEIGDPKKSSGHYIASKSVLLTIYSVKKYLIDNI